MPRFQRKTYERGNPPPTGYVVITQSGSVLNTGCRARVSVFGSDGLGININTSQINTPRTQSATSRINTGSIQSFLQYYNLKASAKASIRGGVEINTGQTAKAQSGASQISFHANMTGQLRAASSITHPTLTISSAGLMQVGYRNFVKEVSSWEIMNWPSGSWQDFEAGETPFLVAIEKHSNYVDFANGLAGFGGQVYSDMEELIDSNHANFERASDGLYTASDGVVTSFASGQPRIGDRGLLIEPSVQNLVTNSNDFVNGWTNTSTAIGEASNVNGATLYAIATTGGSGWARMVSQALSIPATSSVIVSQYMMAGSSSKSRISLRNVAGFNTSTIWQWNNAMPSYSQTIENQSNKMRVNDYGAIDLGSGLYRLWTKFENLETSAQSFRIEPHVTDNDNTAYNIAHKLGSIQVETGNVLHEYVATGASATTKPADIFTLFPDAGAYDITITFDDESTQTLGAQSVTSSGWAVPTDLNRPHVKSILFDEKISGD